LGGDPAAEAFARALRDLSGRERTAAEVRTRLQAWRLDEAQVEEVLDRLEATGAVDDRRFARRFAEDKRDLSGWGDARIRVALERRGVVAELVEETLGHTTAGAELDRALQALSRRGGGLSSDSERQRALAFLVRRGYDLDLAYDAVRRLARAA
jgi:regulatory protein